MAGSRGPEGERRRRLRLLVLVAGVVAVLTRCAGADDDAVRRAAAAFADADASGRCALLLPSTRSTLEADESVACPQVMGELPVGSGDVVSVEVWGTDALVRLDDDTAFLALDDDGWRVSAAACRPAGRDEPYQCQVEGS